MPKLHINPISISSIKLRHLCEDRSDSTSWITDLARKVVNIWVTQISISFEVSLCINLQLFSISFNYWDSQVNAIEQCPIQSFYLKNMFNVINIEVIKLGFVCALRQTYLMTVDDALTVILPFIKNNSSRSLSDCKNHRNWVSTKKY